MMIHLREANVLTLEYKPKGLHFSLITDDDLIRVDHDGKVVDGGNNRRLNYGKAVI